jgi:maleamate amidohydrolase
VTRPWDGVVPEAEIRALEARGQAVDRETTWGRAPCLLVVDMTRGFVERGYPASCADTGGDEATAANEVLLASARAAGIPVLFTNSLHHDVEAALPASRRTGLATKAALLATPEGLPDGNAIADRLAPVDGEVVISKPKPSAFYGTPLDAYLNLLEVDSLIVTGMVTSGCVRATVVDASMRNHLVIVPEESVADYSTFQHRTSLLDMHVKYAEVPLVADVVAHLAGLGD